MSLESNRQLLEGYRRGEREALGQVYDMYSNDVVNFLRRGFSFSSQGKSYRMRPVSSPFKLEDWLQEVFIRAFSERARTQYDGITSFKTYLFTITRNLVIDDLRRKEHALRVDVQEDDNAQDASPLNRATDDAVDPAQMVEDTQLVKLVQAFKDTLGPRERTVFEFRFEQELEHKDIQKQTGLSPSRIKTSERRIREAFFRFMRRHGYFGGYRLGSNGWINTQRSF